MDAPDPPALSRKPSRAETARRNGALSRGPVTEGGKARSSMNGLVHGLRARRWLAVPALGEAEDEAGAHMTAVREELGAAGPVARHLAETAACSMLRASRAERLEGELLAGLAEGERGVAAALHADRESRATLALLQRYRREADGELRRSLDALLRLHRARADGLLPDGEQAEAAQAGLDEAVAALPAPIEPRIERIELLQPVRPGSSPAANDDRAAAAPAPPRETGAQMLATYRSYGPAVRPLYWRKLTEEQHREMLAAAEEERRAKAEGRDPDTLHARAAPLLAG